MSESDSDSDDNHEGKLDDSRMEYRSECNECKCSSMMNDNIECEYNILCDNITGMWNMNI